MCDGSTFCNLRVPREFYLNVDIIARVDASSLARMVKSLINFREVRKPRSTLFASIWRVHFLHKATVKRVLHSPPGFPFHFCDASTCGALTTVSRTVTVRLRLRMANPTAVRAAISGSDYHGYLPSRRVTFARAYVPRRAATRAFSARM